MMVRGVGAFTNDDGEIMMIKLTGEKDGAVLDTLGEFEDWEKAAQFIEETDEQGTWNEVDWKDLFGTDDATGERLVFEMGGWSACI